jgi:hypothetical protein
MVANFETLILAAICAAVAVSTVVFFWALLARATNGLPASEALLIASVLTVLGINAEVRILTLFPVKRPLDLLPWAHLIILGLAFAAIQRRYGFALWLGFARDLRRSASAQWSTFPMEVRIGVIVALLLMTGYGIYGLSIGASGWDELAYHVPQAVQLYQDGRLGDLDSWLPWTYAYPKGAAILWAWTMFFTRSDFLFHTVQLAFGLQLLLAVYTLARRSGGSVPSTVAVLLALSCMPIMAILTTQAGADIGYAAGCVGLLAFSAPPREVTGRVLWPYAALFFAQAALIKLPVIAIIFGIIGILCAFLRSPRATLAAMRAGVRSVVGALAILAVLWGLYLPVTNWVSYRNPMYPLAVSVGPIVIWRGPSPAFQHSLLLDSHTSFRELPKHNIVRLYHAVLADWFGPKNYDSTGTYGPVVLSAFLFLFAAFVYQSFSLGDPWRIALSVATAIVVLLPGAYMPRYGLPMVAVVAAACSVFMSTAPPSFERWLRASVLTFGFAGAMQSAVWLYTGARYMSTINGGIWLSPLRSSRFQETVQMGISAYYPSPQMIRAIRTYAKAGDLMVWNISCFHGLLWNRDYSNRTLFLSATEADRFPGGPEQLSRPSAQELSQWVTRLRQLSPDQVLVYSQSAYAEAVRTLTAPRYIVAFSEDEAKGRGAIVLFQRKHE